MTPKDKLVALAQHIVDQGVNVDEVHWKIVHSLAVIALQSVEQEQRTSDAARKGFGAAEKSES